MGRWKQEAKWVLVTWLVVGWVAVAKSSPFTECYLPCTLRCVPFIALCPDYCMRGCVGPAAQVNNANTELHTPQQNLLFCQLGCASSTCSTLSTKENPDAEKVEICVKSCSQTCSLSY